LSTVHRVAEGKTYETCSSAPWNPALSGKRPSDYCRFQSCRHTQRGVLQSAYRLPGSAENNLTKRKRKRKTEKQKRERKFPKIEEKKREGLAYIHICTYRYFELKQLISLRDSEIERQLLRMLCNVEPALSDS